MTYQDIRSVGNFADQTVMAVKAPPDTRLEVPDPKQSLQIWLKSQNGAIEVSHAGVYVLLRMARCACRAVQLGPQTPLLRGPGVPRDTRASGPKT